MNFLFSHKTNTTKRKDRPACLQTFEFYFIPLPQFRIHLRNKNTGLVTTETTKNIENLHYTWRFLSVNFRNPPVHMQLSIAIFLLIQVTVQILEGHHMTMRVRKKKNSCQESIWFWYFLTRAVSGMVLSKYNVNLKKTVMSRYSSHYKVSLNLRHTVEIPCACLGFKHNNTKYDKRQYLLKILLLLLFNLR